MQCTQHSILESFRGVAGSIGSGSRRLRARNMVWGLLVAAKLSKIAGCQHHSKGIEILGMAPGPYSLP